MSSQVQSYFLQSALGDIVRLPSWEQNNPIPPSALVIYPSNYSVQWSASADLTSNVPAYVRLGVGPYQSTMQENFTRFIKATNESSQTPDWYLIPIDPNENSFWISGDPSGQYVWTVETGYPPLAITYRNESNLLQQFKFLPAQ